jgi:2-keto-4-pentenoate hydratase/2-oxohepta-3-ene-1,7-dioic acid hydratase in catechol pathway
MLLLNRLLKFQWGWTAKVIGKQAKHLAAENALEHVVGYTCSNDGFVREYQRYTIQWTMRR